MNFITDMIDSLSRPATGAMLFGVLIGAQCVDEHNHREILEAIAADCVCP